MDKKTASASAGTVLSLVFGVGLQVSGYQNAYLAGACFLLSGLLAIYIVVLHWPAKWRWQKFIPLPEAARLLYEEARRSNSIWAEAAERLRATPGAEGILDYLATGIAAEVEVYGRRAPATRLDIVPTKLFSQGGIIEGGCTLLLWGSNIRIEDLHVARRGVKLAIAAMVHDQRQ